MVSHPAASWPGSRSGLFDRDRNHNPDHIGLSSVSLLILVTRPGCLDLHPGLHPPGIDKPYPGTTPWAPATSRSRRGHREPSQSVLHAPSRRIRTEPGRTRGRREGHRGRHRLRRPRPRGGRAARDHIVRSTSATQYRSDTTLSPTPRRIPDALRRRTRSRRLRAGHRFRPVPLAPAWPRPTTMSL